MVCKTIGNSIRTDNLQSLKFAKVVLTFVESKMFYQWYRSTCNDTTLQKYKVMYYVKH